MKIGEITGSVVSTMKLPTYHGEKILTVQPLDLNLQPKGDVVLAIDNVDAGVGDRVLLLQEGGVVKDVLKIPHASPIRSIVIGVIDEIQSDPEGEVS